MSTNPFVLEKNEYARDINVLNHYVKDSALYLQIMTGKPLEECLNFIKTSLKPGGRFQFNDPDIMFLERGDNGDREQKTGKLSEYINTAIKEKDLIAPTLTLYLNPNKKKSILVDFIDTNVTARSIAKKAMFAAKMIGDFILEAFKKGEQTNKKLNNNAISGAHVSASTPLYNKTAHSTLTSNCRTTSGYGNANNEKFLCGNRHYWSPDIIRNNIISISNNTNYSELENALLNYGIRHPTVKETMDCIHYSADLYWKGIHDFERLELLVSNLTDIQRSAFVYTGDLYHLMKFNDKVVRDFIDCLTKKSVSIFPKNYSTCALPKEDLEIIDKANTIIKQSNDDVKNLASQICCDELKGKSVKDIVGTDAYGIYAGTVININECLFKYSELIKALWVTPNVSASLAVFPDSIRRAAITSDTDSTIFTVQDWVIWHHGELGFGQKEDATAAAIIFLAAQSIIHVLARMSANFGIEEKRIHQIAMKNEFKFPVFIPTQVAKHYYALISCQEGNIFAELEKEIKGVHLKSSNAPKIITLEAERMMKFIMNTVIEGKTLNLNEMLKWVADVERQVVDSIMKGSHEYFRIGQIKPPGSYKNTDDAAPYQQYLLWQEVFAPKYGDTQLPPYTTIKVGVDIDTPTKTREWLAAIEDKEIVAKLENWLISKGKTSFGSTFMLPEQCITSKGVPIEIAKAIAVRKIVKDTTNIFYIILESIGVYMLTDKLTRLCYDTY